MFSLRQFKLEDFLLFSITAAHLLPKKPTFFRKKNFYFYFHFLLFSITAAHLLLEKPASSKKTFTFLFVLSQLHICCQKTQHISKNFHFFIFSHSRTSAVKEANIFQKTFTFFYFLSQLHICCPKTQQLKKKLSLFLFSITAAHQGRQHLPK